MSSKQSHKDAHRQTQLLKAIFDQPGPVVIYQSRRSLALRFCFFVSLVCSVAVTYLIIAWPQEMAVKELGSVTKAIALKIGLLLIGNIFTGAFLWLAPKYSMQIDLLPGQMLQIKRFMGRSLIRPVSAIYNSPEYHPGTSQFHNAPSVNAPWISIRFGNKQKIVVDLQGDFPEGYAVFEKVIEGEGDSSRD